MRKYGRRLRIKINTMRKILKQSFLIIILSAICLIANTLNALPNDHHSTENTPQSFDQMGFEIEIGDRHFAEIIQYFDTTQLEQEIQHILTTPEENIPQKQKNSVLKTRIKLLQILGRSIDRYLENENAFNSLPADIQAELSDGLDLHKKTEIAQKTQEFSLTDSQGQPIDQTSPRIVRNDHDKYVTPNAGLIVTPNIHGSQNIQSPSGLIIPKNSQLSNDFVNANAHLYQRSDWPVVFARWKKMSFEQKLQLIQFNFLPKQTLASLILSLDLYQHTKKPDFFKAHLPLKTNAPDWFKDYEIDFDGVEGHISIEIRASGPKPIHMALDLLESMFKRLRINPDRSTYANQSRLDYGLHIHLGQKDKPEAMIDFSKNPRILGKPIEFFQKYKVLTILRLFAANPEANIEILRSYIETKSLNLPSRTTQNEFYLPLETKGILRLVGLYHIELREIVGDPKQALAELNSLLKLDDESAITEIDKLTQNILNKQPELWPVMSKKNPFILLELEQVLSPKTKSLVADFFKKHYIADEYGFIDLAAEMKSLSPTAIYKLLECITPYLQTNQNLISKFIIYLFPAFNQIYSNDPNMADQIDTYLIENKFHPIFFEFKTKNPEILRQKVSILMNLVQDTHSPYLGYFFNLIKQYQYIGDDKLSNELKPLLSIKDIGPLASIAVNRKQIYFLSQDAILKISQTSYQIGKNQLNDYFHHLLNTYYSYDSQNPNTAKLENYLENHIGLLNSRHLNNQFKRNKSLKTIGHCEGLF